MLGKGMMITINTLVATIFLSLAVCDVSRMSLDIISHMHNPYLSHEHARFYPRSRVQ